eukprot:ANDGO_01999.mRNA.1 Transmembrane channel-like protein 1
MDDVGNEDDLPWYKVENEASDSVPADGTMANDSSEEIQEDDGKQGRSEAPNEMPYYDSPAVVTTTDDSGSVFAADMDAPASHGGVVIEPPGNAPSTIPASPASAIASSSSMDDVPDPDDPVFVEVHGDHGDLVSQKSTTSLSNVAVRVQDAKRSQSVRLSRFSNVANDPKFKDVCKDVIDREVSHTAAPKTVEVEYVDGDGLQHKLHSFVRKSKLETGKRSQNWFSQALVSWWLFIAPVISRMSPLRNSVRQIEGLFGNGVGSLFNFSRFLIHLNFAVGIIWLGVTMIPWFLSPPAAWRDKTVAKDYLGFFGVGGLEYTWVYYGGYAPEAASYNMAVGYTCAIFFSFVFVFFVIIIALRRQVMRDQATESLIRHDRQFKFTSIIFGAWDWKVEARPAAMQIKSGLVNILRELMEEIRVKMFLSERKKTSDRLFLYACRLCGILLFTIIFLACSGIIFVIALNQASLNSVFPYMVSVIVSFINFVVPPLIHATVSMERWVNTKIVFRNTVGRVYFVKMVNIVVLVVSVQNLDRLTGGRECVETDAGQMFWQLLIVDFLLCALDTTIMGPLKHCISGQPVSIKFSSEVNELIYRQGLIWIGTCVSPMMPFLGALSNVVLFYIRKWIVIKTCRPPSRPWAVASATSFFLWFLLFTLFIAALPTTWFMQRSSSTVCGPHVGVSSPWASIPQQISYAPNYVQYAIEYIGSPLVLGPAVLVLAVCLYFKSASLVRLQERFDYAVQEMDTERSDKIALLRQFNIRL